MSRNAFVPSWNRNDLVFQQTENIPEYRMGKVADSTVQGNSCSGFMSFATGRNFLFNLSIRRGDLPEIPSLEILEQVGWSYYDTKFYPESMVTVYRFLLPEEKADQSTMVVQFYDLLYG